jgi:hypothetical protein
VKAPPIPKNKPVPIVPPRAMNWICLDFRLWKHGCQLENLDASNFVGFVVDLPSSNVSIFLSSLDISVKASSLSEATGLSLDSGVSIDVGVVSMAIVVWRLVDGVLILLHGC